MLVSACQEPQGPTETRVDIRFQMHNLTSMISTPPEESLQAHVHRKVRPTANFL